MAQKQLHVALISHTPEPEKAIARAAKTCYSPATVDELSQRIEQADQSRFIRMLLKVGHLSTVEHVSFTFAVEGVSRTLLAQITRHRIASFSVQSQRYVSKIHTDGTVFDYIIPPSILALGEQAAKEYEQQMRTMQTWYNTWQERLGNAGSEAANEDARFVLPNAAETRFLVTMNARELMHFFSLRCCGRAQWEIRALAWEMLKLARQVAPVLFERSGPPCLFGPCPEGNKSCRKQKEMKERSESLHVGI